MALRRASWHSYARRGSRGDCGEVWAATWRSDCRSNARCRVSRAQAFWAPGVRVTPMVSWASRGASNRRHADGLVWVDA